MQESTDTISVNLKVTAVQMDMDIWMQGELEIIINGEKPYTEGDIVDSETLLKSLEQDGEYYIFSCCCGIPECGGWTRGISVTHTGDTTTWIDFDNAKTWHLEKAKMEEDFNLIREQVKIFKHYFQEKKIKYVGVGYSWQ